MQPETHPVRTRFLMFLLMTLASAGCSEELGPEAFPTGKVSGTIRAGANALRGGFIEFHPYIGTRGTFRVAPIDANGHFEAEGVPTGRVLIGFEDLPGGSIPSAIGPVASAYLRVPRSGILRDIEAGPMTIDLDLSEEVLRVVALGAR